MITRYKSTLQIVKRDKKKTVHNWNFFFQIFGKKNDILKNILGYHNFFSDVCQKIWGYPRIF